jgi:hypothetical protein
MTGHFAARPGAPAAYDATVKTRVAEPDLVIDLRDPPEPDPSLTPLRRRSDLVLLVAMNVLNLLDGLLTYLVTRAGIAVEANPLVTWMTLPGKIAFVAALSIVLWWLRPRALLVPVVAYSAIVAYTIAGAIWLSP